MNGAKQISSYGNARPSVDLFKRCVLVGSRFASNVSRRSWTKLFTFYTYDVYTSTVSSSIIRYILLDRKQIIAQHSKAQTTSTSISGTSSRRSERENAFIYVGRQTAVCRVVGWSQHVVKHYYSLLSVFSKRTKNRNLLGLPKSVFTQAAYYTAGVMCEGLACTLVFLSVLYISSMHASGLFAVDNSYGAPGICKPAVCTENHGHICPLHSFAFCPIPPRDRDIAGSGSRPRAHRSTFYTALLCSGVKHKKTKQHHTSTLRYMRRSK